MVFPVISKAGHGNGRADHVLGKAFSSSVIVDHRLALGMDISSFLDMFLCVFESTLAGK
jgi:hypothetical protein